MVKPVRRLVIGISTLGVLSLVRSLMAGGESTLTNPAPERTGRGPTGTPISAFQAAAAYVIESLDSIAGPVDTASAATPCDPRDNTPNPDYCYRATPTPKPTAKPIVTPKPATPTPKPSTTPAPVSGSGLPSKPVFQASSTNVRTGTSVTLTWQSTGAASCTLSPGSIVKTGTTGSFTTPKLTGNTTYSLACHNNVGTTAASPLTISVSATGATSSSSGPAAILSFVAEPTNISSGQTSTLTWVATGIPKNGCILAPSQLNRADATGTWTTPYLLGSKTYNLSCAGADGQVVYASTTVTVDGIVAYNGASEENQAQTFTTADGQTIMNAMVLGEVKGLVALDPELFTVPGKAKLVERVEFYEGANLTQTVIVSPYALNTTKLPDGSHTITQKTYFRSGSPENVTRTFVVKNATAAAKTSSDSGTMVFITVMLVLVVGAGLGGAWWFRRQAAKRTEPQPTNHFRF